MTDKYLMKVVGGIKCPLACSAQCTDVQGVLFTYSLHHYRQNVFNCLMHISITKGLNFKPSPFSFFTDFKRKN